MGNQTPVLEWRCADAAKKLLKASDDLGLSLPDGDDLNADNRRKWIYGSAAGALIATDLKAMDHQEMILRMQGVTLGVLSSASELELDERKAFGSWLLSHSLALMKST